jgi:hypothetical protein
MSLIEILVLCALVVYRVTRFLIADTLIEGTRTRFGDWLLGSEPKVWRDKLYDLTTCPYCLSIWVSAATVAVVDAFMSVPLPVLVWLASAGLAMVVWRIVELPHDDK